MNRLILPRRALLKAGAAALITSPAIIGKAAAQLGGGLMFPGPGTAGGFTTFDSATLANGTLSPDNLTFTQTSTTTDGGARALSGKSSGKVCFEAHCLTTTPSAGGGIGISNTTPSYATINGPVTNATIVFGSGNLWDNGSLRHTSAIPALTTGVFILFAFDITGRLVWVTSDGTTWSGSAVNTPMNGLGGDTFGAYSGPYFPTATGVANNGDIWTVDFGSSTFHFAAAVASLVGAGYAAGWRS